VRSVVLRLVRANVRASAPAVLGGTLAEHVLLVFAAVQLDAIVDWDLVSRDLGALPSPAIGALYALFAWSWARTVGRALPRPAWIGPLPLSPSERAVVVLAPALAAVAPILWLASLYPGGWLFPVGVALWVPILAVRGRYVPVAAASIALGSFVPALAAMAALPFAGRALDGFVAVGTPGWKPGATGWGWKPRATGWGWKPGATVSRWLFAGRTRAQVARDGVILARLAPWSVAGLLLQAVPAWGAERAVAADGSHELGAIVILAIASLLVVAALGQAARALGSRFDPAEWPLSPADRALGLAASAAAGLLPAWLAVVWAAPRAVIAASLAVAALAAGAAWVVAADRRGIEGRAMWWAMAVAFAGVASPLAPALLVPIAAWRASRALARQRC
jgi:hypothetical protein